MGAREVTANAVPVATLIKRVPSAAVANVVMTANAAKSLRDAAVVASVVERQVNASVMNTNAATVATLSSKLVDAVTTRRFTNQKPQKSLSQSLARRSLSKSKILIN